MQLIVFALIAFVLGFIIIANREQIPQQLRRPLAIFAILTIASAFVMVVARFLLMEG